MAGEKRKRPMYSANGASGTRKRMSPRDEIERLEAEIQQSRQNYNHIVRLISMVKEQSTNATVALCRVFCRLIAAGNLRKSKDTAANEVVIVQWLRERYAEYTALLLDNLDSVHLKLAMRLVTEDARERGDSGWKHGLFGNLLKRLFLEEHSDPVLQEFTQDWVHVYDDVRFHTLRWIPQLIQTSRTNDGADGTQAYIDFLTSISSSPESQRDIQSFLGHEPSLDTKSPLRSVTAHKKQAQEAWLSVLRAGLEKSQRKRVLAAMDRRIVPWFVKVELLMDFLTDSYNLGGSTSLLALSGLFHLIQKRNLDYPSFYQKLYTLLDDSLLHSKHRSMFLRLLDTFMSSTHLPAALVASFIKRLSRLALHAPPAAIVAIVPWTYNMFKKHPTCTFMIHREIRDSSLKGAVEANGFEDPFDMDELDPMETGALESSLWEIETLRSHYHPNVASIAKIISAQFSKQSYNVEDFLDHSYNGLIGSELSRDLKKTPVVEYEIPKRIFLDSDGECSQLGQLLKLAMETEQKERGVEPSAQTTAVIA